MSKRNNRRFTSGWLPKLAIGFMLFLPVFTKGQVQVTDNVYYTDEDRVIFDRFLSVMIPESHLPMDRLMVKTASFFLGTPYVASTLEREPEGLVVNLREMDCATLVDNVLALSRTLKGGDHSFNAFCRQLQHIRYRGEEIRDYTDRLHYTSDWIYVNEQKKTVKDVTKKTGGTPLSPDIHFMSTHPDSYRQLKADPGLIKKMAMIENEINARLYYYIPEAEIPVHARKMKDGDIVCFTTSIKGLDTSHMGILTRDGDMLTFIHASSVAKKVIINKESLQTYVEKGKSCTGIMLARPLFK